MNTREVLHNESLHKHRITLLFVLLTYSKHLSQNNLTSTACHELASYEKFIHANDFIYINSFIRAHTECMEWLAKHVNFY